MGDGGCCRSLDLTGPLLLGGVPTLPESFPIRSRQFVGCMRHLHIDQRPVDMAAFIANNGTLPGEGHRGARGGGQGGYGAGEMTGGGRGLCPLGVGWGLGSGGCQGCGVGGGSMGHGAGQRLGVSVPHGHENVGLGDMG